MKTRSQHHTVLSTPLINLCSYYTNSSISFSSIQIARFAIKRHILYYLKNCTCFSVEWNTAYGGKDAYGHWTWNNCYFNTYMVFNTCLYVNGSCATNRIRTNFPNSGIDKTFGNLIKIFVTLYLKSNSIYRSTGISIPRTTLKCVQFLVDRPCINCIWRSGLGSRLSVLIRV